MRWRTPAVIPACGGLVLMLALGTRQSFGLFLRPMSLDLGHMRRIATAYCLTPCEVVAIHGDALTRLMESDAGLGYALMKKLAVLLTSELVAFAAG